MKNKIKLDVHAHCAHIPKTEMSTTRINQSTNLTLRPNVKRASKKYFKVHKKSNLSRLTSDLLEDYFKKHGYLPSEAA